MAFAQMGYLDYQQAKLHYGRFGSGPNLLFAFHGFGDRAQIFLALQAALSTQFTVYAFDLPYHGRTQWPMPEFTPEDIKVSLLSLLEHHQVNQCSLMGYSFGGRVVQALLPLLGDTVQQLYLIAPDGLATKGMRLAQSTPIALRHYFSRLVLNRPQLFLAPVRRLYNWGLVSRFIRDFLHKHLETKERRARVLGFWLSLQHFNIQLEVVQDWLKDRPEVNLKLYYGSRDEIVTVEGGHQLMNGLPNAQLYLIEEGHRLIDDDLNELMQEHGLP